MISETGEKVKVLTYDEAKAIEKGNANYKGQEFFATKKAYILDAENKCLVENGEMNVYEKIQSNADCALNVILDKYLDLGIEVPNLYNIDFDENVDAIDDCIEDRDKLEVKLKYDEYMKDLRKKYNVPDNVSDKMFVDSLNAEIAKRNEALKASAENAEKVQEKENKNEEIQIKQES